MFKKLAVLVVVLSITIGAANAQEILPQESTEEPVETLNETITWSAGHWQYQEAVLEGVPYTPEWFDDEPLAMLKQCFDPEENEAYMISLAATGYNVNIIDGWAFTIDRPLWVESQGDLYIGEAILEDVTVEELSQWVLGVLCSEEIITYDHENQVLDLTDPLQIVIMPSDFAEEITYRGNVYEFSTDDGYVVAGQNAARVEYISQWSTQVRTSYLGLRGRTRFFRDEAPAMSVVLYEPELEAQESE